MSTPHDPLTCGICGLPIDPPVDDALAMICPGCGTEPAPTAVPRYVHKERKITQEPPPITDLEREAMKLPPYVGVLCPSHQVVHVPVALFLQARNAFSEWRAYLDHLLRLEVAALAADAGLEAIRLARPSDTAALEAAQGHVTDTLKQAKLVRSLAAEARADALRLNAQVTAGMFIQAGRGEDPDPTDGSGLPPANA